MPRVTVAFRDGTCESFGEATATASMTDKGALVEYTVSGTGYSIRYPANVVLSVREDD